MHSTPRPRIARWGGFVHMPRGIVYCGEGLTLRALMASIALSARYGL